MKRFLVPFAIMTGVMMPTTAESASRRLINNGWRFHLTDSVTFNMQPEAIADSLWSDVRLPHDWSIRLHFSREAAPGNDGGYLPAGKGWYKTVLDIPKLPADRMLKLYFEGVYEKSEVYVNGHPAGGHPYGYTSFFVDITPYLKAGNNEIMVKADNYAQKNSRWYTGSGIYRNVWLVESADIRVADFGVGIQTPDLSTADITVTVENTTSRPREVEVTADVDGILSSQKISLTPNEMKDTRLTIRVPNAKPWSPDTPVLYTARISVSENGKAIDTAEETFGFRTIGWNAVDGVTINGKSILLNGGCVHHDNGILGAAAYDRAERRKAEQLKEAGFNAVRTSHNPPSEAFLKACDELGLLVIDEAFDGWRDAKNDFDYHLLFDEWSGRDLEAMVRRDRNHPSVICWSIGNEIMERKKPQAVADAHRLAGICRSIDTTRPVTQALASWDADWEIYDPLAAEHDIVGYNYMIHKAEGDHERVPDRVMIQTESYPKDVWSNYRMAKDHSYVAGDFVWTAIDYIGESGIGRWYYEGDVEGEHYQRPLYPWHAAYCGDIDLTGLRKPVSHYRSMLWNGDGEKLYIAVREPDGYNGRIKTTQWGTWPTFESWNWPGHEGKPIEVEVYSRYPQVRLYQDGKLVREKQTEDMKAVFTVDYAPGRIVAKGVDNGEELESMTLESAGDVAAVRLTADRNEIAADGEDLSYITIECVDDKGHVVPVADNELTVTVDGPIELIGLGNADIKDNDPYFDSTHKAWKGRALGVVRSNGNAGAATVTVKTKNASGADITSRVKINASGEVRK